MTFDGKGDYRRGRSGAELSGARVGLTTIIQGKELKTMCRPLVV